MKRKSSSSNDDRDDDVGDAKSVPSIARPPFAKKRCFYEAVFANDGTGEEAINKSFRVLMDFIIRNHRKTGTDYTTQEDLQTISDIETVGNPIAKLLAMLGVIVHEPGLREQLVAKLEPEIKQKTDDFFRVLSIYARSCYTSPIREDNSQQIMLTALEFVYITWACCNLKQQAAFCNRFSAIMNDDVDEKEARETAQTLTNEIMIRDRKAQKEGGGGAASGESGKRKK